MHPQKRIHDGVAFLRLRGTYVERCTQHAELMRGELKDGAPAVLAKKNLSLILAATHPPFLAWPRVQKIIIWLYNQVLMRVMDRNISEEDRKILMSLAHLGDLSYYQARECLFQPDVMALLSKMSVTRYLLGEHARSEFLGCTSVILNSERTQTGGILHGRNMDYPLVGAWEKYPVVLFHEPTEKDQIPYVGASTAGVYPSGLTAMNSAGLTLATHIHITRQTRFRGVPIPSLGEQLIRTCKSISEAVDFVRKRPRLGSWSFVISSAQENRGVVIEMTPTQERVVEMDRGFLSHSNYFQNSELSKQEALVSGGVYDDCLSRVYRMRQLFKNRTEKVEPTDILGALGDSIEPETGERRVIGNTVSVVTTVKSVLMEPGAQNLWMSAKTESPTAMDGKFLKIPIQGFWKKGVEPERVTVPVSLPSGFRESVKLHRQAFVLQHTLMPHAGSLEASAELLGKAVDAYPHDGNLWVQWGLVLLKTLNYHRAKEVLEEAQKRKLSKHVYQVSDLFLARCLDVLGGRELALNIYSKFTRVDEPRLKKAYQAGLRRPFRSKDGGRVFLDLQFVDALEY